MTMSRRVRLSSKGQLVIPQDLRELLGVGPGDELILHLLSDRMVLAEVAPRSRFEQAVAGLRAEAKRRGITRTEVEQALSEAKREIYDERWGKPDSA